jgi:hypothetical protein
MCPNVPKHTQKQKLNFLFPFKNALFPAFIKELNFWHSGILRAFYG